MNPLTIELLAWIAVRPRTYGEAMEAWRSNCPRHSVWEDALIAGFIETVDGGDTLDESKVTLTTLGRTILDEGNRTARVSEPLDV
jgi:hypothetical protein